MSEEDIAFTQSYFRDEEKRAPSLTEIRMLDTYWSDHCRHTTFLTAIDEVTFAPGAETIEESYAIYRKVREKIGRDDKPVTLMDIALIGMRELKASGELDNLEVSEEINAASIVVPVSITGGADPTQPAVTEEWLIQKSLAIFEYEQKISGTEDLKDRLLIQKSLNLEKEDLNLLALNAENSINSPPVNSIILSYYQDIDILKPQQKYFLSLQYQDLKYKHNLLLQF